MTSNYNKIIKDILYKIYENKLFQIALKKDIYNINNSNLDYYKYFFKSHEIHLGNEVDSLIIDFLPKGADGYFFRCEIARNKNCYFPKLYDSHMNNFLTQDVYKSFNKEDFYNFIDSNLGTIFNDINNYVLKVKDFSEMHIPFSTKEDVISVIKQMILNKELDFNYVYELIDLNKLRDEMSKSFTPLNIYDEFDKLEDDTKYCLDNFFKFDENETIKFFIDNNFKYIENIGLVKQ